MKQSANITITERDRRLIRLATHLTDKELFGIECFITGVRMAAGNSDMQQDVAAARDQTPEGAAV